MKKLIFGLFFCLIVSVNAYAVPMYWDLDTIGYNLNNNPAATDLYITNDLTIRNDGLTNGIPFTDITITLQNSGTISNGDTFVEQGLLGVVGSGASGFDFYDTNGARGYIFYEFLNITGSIQNVLNFPTFSLFDIIFDNVGTINLKYGSTPTLGLGTLIATYDLLSGSTQSPGFSVSTGVGAGNGIFGFDLKVETIDIPNFWYILDGGSYVSANTFLGTTGIYATSTMTGSIINPTPIPSQGNTWNIKVQNVGTIEHAIPEPSTMLLLGAGLLGLGALGRRRKN